MDIIWIGAGAVFFAASCGVVSFFALLKAED